MLCIVWFRTSDSRVCYPAAHRRLQEASLHTMDVTVRRVCIAPGAEKASTTSLLECLKLKHLDRQCADAHAHSIPPKVCSGYVPGPEDPRLSQTLTL